MNQCSQSEMTLFSWPPLYFLARNQVVELSVLLLLLLLKSLHWEMMVFLWEKFVALRQLMAAMPLCLSGGVEKIEIAVNPVGASWRRTAGLVFGFWEFVQSALLTTDACA